MYLCVSVYMCGYGWRPEKGVGSLGWCKLPNGVAKSQTWVPWKSRTYS